MHQYAVRDVERMLGLPRSTVRALVEAGFVSPARGPRNAWLFSFQDLIVLRTAKALASAKVPRRRIIRSLKELRRHLPGAMPLSGLAIAAVGDRVVVKNGASAWQADSGQYLLAFEGNPADGSLNVIDRVRPAQPSPRTGDWFDKAVALENTDPAAAIEAYGRAVAAAPSHRDAHINLARLLHEANRLPEAEAAYRSAIKACGNDALLLYNFGVLLDDMDRKPEAIAAYEEALASRPDMADCHYNLALLYEDINKQQQAIRHLAQYRRLMGKDKTQ
jgi:tetratricopeptide (TPR) repeat protein